MINFMSLRLESAYLKSGDAPFAAIFRQDHRVDGMTLSRLAVHFKFQIPFDVSHRDIWTQEAYALDGGDVATVFVDGREDRRVPTLDYLSTFPVHAVDHN